MLGRVEKPPNPEVIGKRDGFCLGVEGHDDAAGLAGVVVRCDRQARLLFRIGSIAATRRRIARIRPGSFDSCARSGMAPRSR
ncbi:hypothetical protein [Rhodophyticola sp.]|uniref:hypothetical protein n=1 Tax=Rhodophyticola sp. TaxID=2680032 RepID=UPI003D29B2B8